MSMPHAVIINYYFLVQNIEVEIEYYGQLTFCFKSSKVSLA